MFSSCQKEEIITPISTTSQDASTTSKLKAATVYAEEYSVKQIYKNYYTHYYEYTGTNSSGYLVPPTVTYSTNSLCGPSALMVATGMVANGEKGQSNYYVVNTSAVGEIIKKMQSAYGNISNFGHTHLYYALGNYLGTFVSRSQCSTTSRDDIKTFIKNELAAGNPVVMPIVIQSGVSSSYDTDHSDVSGRSYYVSMHDITGAPYFGHFIVINKLQLESTGSGYVEYYDVLGTSTTIKRSSYTRILNSNMWSSSYNNAYCAFAVKKK